MAQLEFTEKAKIDLSNIIDYTNETWGSEQAANYLNNIENICILLSENPHIGKSLNEEIMGYPFESHRIFYQHRNDIMSVIRILHKNMLPEKHL